MPDSATSANTPAGASGDARPWIVLIVDDEPAVHQVTRLALRSFDFDGHALELLSAYSVAEAKRVLGGRDDVAVILLDVVMETESAGLDLVRHIREEIGNEAIRIVLRTGQPGYAPEERIVRDYDIKLHESAFDLAECVDACLSQLELGNTRRTLRLDDGAPIRIRADFTAVQRMLLALLVGVLRESDPSRRVEAAARKLGDGRIILYIVDDGADIDQALLTRMSDAKGEEAYYEEETGLGIGFAVARLLIERHGGELRLEARGAGGMRANLIFPKERAAD